jgi:hypothetical protein
MAPGRGRDGLFRLACQVAVGLRARPPLPPRQDAAATGRIRPLVPDLGSGGRLSSRTQRLLGVHVRPRPPAGMRRSGCAARACPPCPTPLVDGAARERGRPGRGGSVGASALGRSMPLPTSPLLGTTLPRWGCLWPSNPPGTVCCCSQRACRRPCLCRHGVLGESLAQLWLGRRR